ncbi:hypothetical protein [Methyloversatilis thermotolerans]|jgi:hypothetical protein|uniref:hypothetical protein n=1 Tax=Methyloversatilis thermotolerans TaxID=1346290 RepID=UPI0003678A3A|nr:hypothetical protein [Methyloversatilis thermotolerans]
MALNAEQLREVARITLAAPTLREAITGVRQALPGVHASAVDPYDMRGEQPALRIGDRDLFLMHSDGHCWSVTTDPLNAHGIVLTQNT